ncbi:MAG: hypothetical protein C3F13_10010 [Anaerolineales bacterium]|nr:helix-turn-helix domain-containing protein [Anaerolineae bacterium]PWB53159.1 MAG: hypothetical protein C3F13_10010 [Anaerolineales bacterium]
MIDLNPIHSAMIDTRVTAPEVIEGYERSGGGIWIRLTPGKMLIKRIRTGLHGNSSQVENYPGRNSQLIKEKRMEKNQQSNDGKFLAESLLTASQVANILHISRSNTYCLMKTGTIPTVHINKSVRVRRQDLEWFIEHNILSSCEFGK